MISFKGGWYTLLLLFSQEKWSSLLRLYSLASHFAVLEPLITETNFFKGKSRNEEKERKRKEERLFSSLLSVWNINNPKKQGPGIIMIVSLDSSLFIWHSYVCGTRESSFSLLFFNHHTLHGMFPSLSFSWEKFSSFLYLRFFVSWWSSPICFHSYSLFLLLTREKKESIERKKVWSYSLISKAKTRHESWERSLSVGIVLCHHPITK